MLLVSLAALVFQIVQTRILSVLAWYYLAFFAISVAMLGMTAGAVWVHLRGARLGPEQLAAALADAASAAALSMPASLALQFSLITTLSLSLTTVVAWSLLLGAMTVPYFFVGIAVSLALTRSPFPVSQVYAVDLVGAALGCVAVVVVLNVLDAPSTVLVAGALAALSAICFARAASPAERARLRARGRARRPEVLAGALATLALGNALSPVRLQPILVKDRFEHSDSIAFERWNSYSRVVAQPPSQELPFFWGPSSRAPQDALVQEIALFIDGAAGTWMPRFEGSPRSIDFLRYDLTNLAYSLPGIQKSAVIGVGGGRDMLSAHLFGVPDVTGVELNPIFVELLTRDPFYSSFNRLAALPGTHFVVDDARSWFAATPERFDLIQMSMIDTWAATGAGAFSLSENGLYTLEGWRTFRSRLSEHGVLTVSRWYSPRNVNETGRMIGLGVAAVLDSGARDARPYLFVAGGTRLATLVLAKSPLTPEQLQALRRRAAELDFQVLLAPDQDAGTPLLAEMARSQSLAELDRVADSTVLDLTVPTDDRPFFFNQLRFSSVPELARQMLTERPPAGVLVGNLLASEALVLILAISLVAVVLTVLVPLRRVTRDQSRRFIGLGSAYFALIGLGFMLAEIGVLQRFSVYLGHPIYSLGVCLFSLILASGLGSLASGGAPAGRNTVIAVGALAAAYLFALQEFLPAVLNATGDRGLAGRIALSLAGLLPLGFLLGFAFPTGMRLVEAIDPRPAPWFWGINGATGVLASVIAVMLSMSFGIGVTLLASAACYLALIPVGVALTAPEGSRAQTSAARSASPRST